MGYSAYLRPYKLSNEYCSKVSKASCGFSQFFVFVLYSSLNRAIIIKSSIIKNSIFDDGNGASMELNLMSSKQAAEQWGITDRQVQSLCFQGKIKDATRLGRAWLIPKDAQKPLDGRTKAAKQVYETAKNGLPFFKEGSIMVGTKSEMNNAEPKNPVIFSFFSGSGFLDLGFEKGGYEVAFVNEISKSFLGAYKYSRTKMNMPEPKYGYYNLDINDFLNGRKDELRQLVEDSKNEGYLVGFIGGPPCPDFSIGGKNKGAEGDNGRLSLAYINLIVDIAPDFFLFENVKGLWSTTRHKAFYGVLKREILKAGYSISERLCNALEFGVPQDRERVFLVGVKNEILRDNVAVSGVISAFPWTKFTTHNVDDIKGLPWSETSAFGEDIALTLDEIMTPFTVQYWFKKNDVDSHPNSKAHFTPRGGIEKMRTVLE